MTKLNGRTDGVIVTAMMSQLNDGAPVTTGNGSLSATLTHMCEITDGTVTKDTVNHIMIVFLCLAA